MIHPILGTPSKLPPNPHQTPFSCSDIAEEPMGVRKFGRILPSNKKK